MANRCMLALAKMLMMNYQAVTSTFLEVSVAFDYFCSFSAKTILSYIYGTDREKRGRANWSYYMLIMNEKRSRTLDRLLRSL